MRPKFVLAKLAGAAGTLAFVLVFNFFLFRVVNDDPMVKLFGWPTSAPSSSTVAAVSSTSTGSKFEQFVAYVGQTLRGNLGDPFLSNLPVMTEIREALWPTASSSAR